ncbi:V-type ATP synthase subunit D [Vagococcus elongatus]|uniref:V-type ATP synthase subunit D n=1 Tax=Vagococcus elongatus TaxID=180344 RepID=A0A430AZP6_9ENTE|nr:V-type ATP synthase subunit D [Vagococcus elongatus]RSU13529.1 hypothetical protein CBF29_04555 [Vagococcus elongatus]
MARLNVNPTRVELRNLTDRLQIATRGHTLLKEKQDSLVRNFREMTEEAVIQRRIVEERLGTLFKNYQHASIESDDRFLQHSLNASQFQMDVSTSLHHVLGVRVPSYRLAELPDKNSVPVGGETSSYYTPIVIKELEVDQEELSENLVKLAELEKKCFLIGEEIIATRRRVNSLEYKTIPDLTETIAYIKMKIEDAERSQIAKLIKL